MFESSKLYRATDPELSVIGAYQSLAKWRFEGRGPAFHKLGSRIVYKGSDLNSWVADQRVKTSEAA